MRLIHTKTFKLAQFHGRRISDYAILSHTWGDGEITFQDWQDLAQCRGKQGWFKIMGACEQARKHGLDYLWVDTICIDKTSSAELSEAINSMFTYYRESTKCYAYLSDVNPKPRDCDDMTIKYQEHFCKSKWFTRGWTLQELLAPTQLTFYAKNWSRIASRSTLASTISSTTNIKSEYLEGNDCRALSRASIAQKMAWLSRRETTRVEDMAYCMLGIFDINMPLLYGEGTKAFIRLQEEIIKVSNDHTIFCWTWSKSVPKEWVSFLAPEPKAFEHSADYIQSRSNLADKRDFSMTNAGLSIRLPVVQTLSYYLAILDAQSQERPPPNGRSTGSGVFNVAIPIRGYLEEGSSRSYGPGRMSPGVMERMSFPTCPCLIQPTWSLCQPDMFIRSRPDTLDSPDFLDERGLLSQYGFLLILDNIWLLDYVRDVRNGAIVSGQMRNPRNELLLRLKPTATDKAFLNERIPRHDLYSSIISYPNGHFDFSQSIVHLDTASTTSGILSSGVLVRVTAACVLFLGINVLPGSSQPLRFCRVLSDVEWNDKDRGTKHLSSLLREQEREMRREVIDHEVDQKDGFSVVVSEGQEMYSGWVLPTYIHHI